MKSLITLVGFAFVVLCASCGNRIIPLKQSYRETAYEFAVPSSKDQVWDKLVEVLSKKGFAIKTIDKSTGLITTDNSSFLNTYSWENQEGSLTNPEAFVVCTRVRGPLTFERSLKPESLTGQWVLLAKQADDKTLVSINLANASGKVYEEGAADLNGNISTGRSFNLTVKSTGVFEKSVEAELK